MPKDQPTIIEVEFEDNRLLPILFGERDRYLKRVSEGLSVSIQARGNRVLIQGSDHDVALAKTVLFRLYDRLKKGLVVSNAEVDAALRLSITPLKENGKSASSHEPSISTRRKVVNARSSGQGAYIQALESHELVFAVGPAGSGKTYLAVATAVSMLLSGQVKKIILSRPAVEAGEHLGFLPGDLKEKVDPYLRPLYDALLDMLPDDTLQKRMESGEIEVAPLAFMRGRTLSNAFIILDEAQNTTEVQMKMFLTRLGENSRMVVTGDLTQIDLPRGIECGLRRSIDILKDVKEIGFCFLTNADIVRHPLVEKIVHAYDDYEHSEKKS